MTIFYLGVGHLYIQENFIKIKHKNIGFLETCVNIHKNISTQLNEF